MRYSRQNELSFDTEFRSRFQAKLEVLLGSLIPPATLLVWLLE